MRAGTDADHPGPFVTTGDIERDARGAEQASGGLGDLLQRALGIARRVGDGAQDFGAGGLTIAVSTQFAQEPGVFHRAGGLLRDRFVALGQTRLQSLLKLGNPAPEIGHHVLGKRGHSLKSILPRAWWRRAQISAYPSGLPVHMAGWPAMPFAPQNRSMSDYSTPDASLPAPP